MRPNIAEERRIVWTLPVHSSCVASYSPFRRQAILPSLLSRLIFATHATSTTASKITSSTNRRAQGGSGLIETQAAEPIPTTSVSQSTVRMLNCGRGMGLSVEFRAVVHSLVGCSLVRKRLPAKRYID